MEKRIYTAPAMKLFALTTAKLMAGSGPGATEQNDPNMGGARDFAGEFDNFEDE